MSFSSSINFSLLSKNDKLNSFILTNLATGIRFESKGGCLLPPSESVFLEQRAATASPQATENDFNRAGKKKFGLLEVWFQTGSVSSVQEYVRPEVDVVWTD